MCRSVRCITKITLSLVMLALWCFALTTRAETVSDSTPFNHSKTGFVLRDVHTTLRCEQCHVGGIFKNTPKECAGCHSIGSRVGATPKPVNHVQTTFSCDVCHVSPTSFLVKSFKHFGIVNGCATCHGDQSGQSLGVVKINRATHIATYLPCENCHFNTSTFLSARMDHSGITSGCASCHGGQSASVVSQPAAHIATNGQDCGACHNTTTFLGATFSHATVVPGTCGNCHLGQQPGVKAMPAVHIPTLTSGNACDACHTSTNTGGYTSFLGAQYHASATAPSPIGICSTCHTGAYPNVLGKSFLPTHVVTTAQCDTCHTASNTANYTTFFGATFNHASPLAACATCHNGVNALGKPVTHVPTTAACDTCHTTALSTLSWLGAIYVHSPTPVVGSCGTCHNGVTAMGKPATHLLTTGACDSCHTTALATSSWLGATGAVDHTTLSPPAAGRCQTCHNGSTAKGLSPGHIPVGALSCDSCHKVYGGAVTTFAPGTMNHTVVVGTSCATCHGGAYTTQGLQYGGAQAKVSNHIPTTITGALDCNTCHTAPTYTSSTGWLQEVMNHNGAVGGAPNYCVTCHLTGVTYLGAMQKKSHNGASTAKDCSSASCHKPLGSKGITYKSWN